MSTRIHPQPGEPYCDNCHGGGDDSVTCNAAHVAWANGFMGHELATLRSEVARLREALVRYGRHMRGCPRPRRLMPNACTCGLDAAMKEKAE